MLKVFGYFVVAIIGLMVDILIFFGLIYGFNFSYLLAGVLGFSVSFLVNYALGRRYVFGINHRFKSNWNEFYSILVVSLFSLLVHQVTLYLCVELLMFSVEISKFFAICASFIINYLGRLFIYKKLSE